MPREVAGPLSVDPGQLAFQGASPNHKWARFVECVQRAVVVVIQPFKGLMEILNETFGKLFSKVER